MQLRVGGIIGQAVAGNNVPFTALPSFHRGESPARWARPACMLSATNIPLNHSASTIRSSARSYFRYRCRGVKSASRSGISPAFASDSVAPLALPAHLARIARISPAAGRPPTHPISPAAPAPHCSGARAALLQARLPIPSRSAYPPTSEVTNQDDACSAMRSISRCLRDGAVSAAEPSSPGFRP